MQWRIITNISETFLRKLFEQYPVPELLFDESVHVRVCLLKVKERTAEFEGLNVIVELFHCSASNVQKVIQRTENIKGDCVPEVLTVLWLQCLTGLFKNGEPSQLRNDTGF